MLIKGTESQDFSPDNYFNHHELLGFIKSKEKITESDVIEFHKKWGPVGALHLLLKVLKSSSAYKFFQQEILIQSTGSFEDNVKKTIFILPHCPYLSRKELDLRTEQMNRGLSRLGFEVHVVPFQYRGTVSENAQVFWDRLRLSLRDDIYLLSFSQGSLEARFLFEQMPDKSEMQKIKGWINLSGLIYGSIDSPSLKWLPFDNFKKNALRGSAFWNRAFSLPISIPVINYYGFPFDAGVSSSLENAKIWGPHDGKLPLIDTLRMPGIICPLEGVDHFGVPAQVSGKLVKIVKWISCLQSSEQKLNWKLSSHQFE